MAALRLPIDPQPDALGNLLTSLDAAYDQVKIARQTLSDLSPPAELSAFLQSVEADLVRAMVVSRELAAPAPNVSADDRVISFAQHRPALSHPA